MNSLDEKNVAIFSGGRGTKNIFGALQGVPLSIDFLINGYDSGLSTGRARWAFEGLLGPSDFRKTLTTVLSRGSPSDREISSLFENRDFLERYINGGTTSRPKILKEFIPNVQYDKGRWIESSLNIFADTKPVQDRTLNLKDFSVGNAIFCSIFVQNQTILIWLYVRFVMN